jgi:hypothetical protein
MRVFMFHPKASVNIATLGRDKPNQTLARCVNFYQHCFTKNITEEIFECDQNKHTEKQHWYKKPHSGKQKHTPLPETKVGMFFPLERLDLIYFWSLRSHFVGIYCLKRCSHAS